MDFVTILIYVIISLALGLSVIGLAFGLIDLNVFANYMTTLATATPNSRLIFTLLGLLIIFNAVRYIEYIFISSPRRRIIPLESPYGNVTITLSAIEDMIKRILESRREITCIKPRIVIKKKEIEVVVRGNLSSELNAIELTKEIQEKIKEKIVNLLGEEREIKVDVEIRKIVFSKKNSIEEKETEMPFRY